MKHLFATFVLTAVALGASAQTETTEEPTDSVGFVFTDIVSVPTTSVKDQNKSGTCWCFAGTSFFEDEIVRKGGKPLDLSEMFTVRQCYLDKGERFVRMYGDTHFASGGSTADVPYVWKRYGAVPEEAYPGIAYGEDKHVHGELDAALTAYLRAIVSKKNGKSLSTAWRKGYEAILDAYLGEVPETFVVDGVTYTPQSYAKSLGLNPDDYVSITSFTHHPFYETFAIEVPDNWLWAQSYNVPLDDLMAITDNALEKGYPVVWAADVSEGGFKWREGYANMPKAVNDSEMEGTELSKWVKLSDKDREAKQFEKNGPVEEMEITQEVRQDMFDRQETTDDHGMELVGIATDQEGNRFYKVKNSWDTNQIYDGFFYVSMPYYKAKTVNIFVHRDALPKEIAKKLNLK